MIPLITAAVVSSALTALLTWRVHRSRIVILSHALLITAEREAHYRAVCEAQRILINRKETT